MLTGMSTFVPSEILHDCQSSSKQRHSVSIVLQSSLIESYAESKFSNQIFVQIYKGDLLVSCISVCADTTIHDVAQFRTSHTVTVFEALWKWRAVVSYLPRVGITFCNLAGL